VADVVVLDDDIVARETVFSHLLEEAILATDVSLFPRTVDSIIDILASLQTNGTYSCLPHQT